MIVEVVLREATILFDRRYSYLWPEHLCQPEIGMRVVVPFGKNNRKKEGYIWLVREADRERLSFSLKEVHELLYPTPVLRLEQIQLCEMMRLRYACTYGEAIRCMLPPGFNLKSNLRDKEERTVSLVDEEVALSMLEMGEFKSVKQERVMEMLLEYGETAVSEIKESIQITEAVLKRLAEKGLIQYGLRTKIEETPPIHSEFSEEAWPPTPEQAYALNILISALLTNPSSDKRRLKEYLLHGVTGSGKTEIYLQLAKEVLDTGRSCLILVPEIALTPQMIERFTGRFGERVAVMHSRLSQRERFEQWKSILNGKVRLLVGVRSAIFMPLQDLALIVVDEEHETSYQSDMNPRYHARTIARLRARDRQCLLLLASATPSVESYARTKTGRSLLLELKNRAGSAELPKTNIVDMRKEIGAGHSSLFSRPLLAAMEDCFMRGEQVMLFINRRGYSGLYLCRSCGHKPYCPHCAVALTYHQARRQGRGRLICHYCGYMETAPTHCPRCGDERIQAYGLGTQQVEASVQNLFPGRKVLRMDQDSTFSKYAFKEILDQFKNREADILIGTQMIAKGHDIPNVTVVGVLACDQLLNGNDYRVNERGFQLITQASGRAGRGDRPGQVYLQSFDPEHPSLLAASRQDYQAFYEEEMTFRKTLGYPPFMSMATIIVSCVDSPSARKHGEYLESLILEAIEDQDNLQMLKLFPLKPAYPSRLYGKSRFQIRIKSTDEAALSYVMRLLRQVKSSPDISLSLILDPA